MRWGSPWDAARRRMRRRRDLESAARKVLHRTGDPTLNLTLNRWVRRRASDQALAAACIRAVLQAHAHATDRAA